MELVLSIWRETSRNVDLTQSVPRLLGIMRWGLPVGLVCVRRLNPGQPAIETIAVAGMPGHRMPTRARTPCTPDAMQRLVVWCGRGEVLQPEGEPDDVLRLLLPEGVEGDVLAGPLGHASGALGGLVLAAETGRRFTDGHRETMSTLLEPLAVALDKHVRFHELARQKEAAEVEKAALLSRLNRREIVEAIIGEDGTLRGVMERVEQVAPTDAPVLILGETGSGKEVVARAIHARSSRREGPIVRVNCGAIPSELIDSELFGHEKGSFTGAVATRQGWFERADGGTLFLDEIGELSLAAQVRLLRVLQDGTYERVGGQRTLTADVRILAATHRDMETLVEQGRFREDLWYRISVFPLYLPPLRARQEDIPALARYFARNAGLRFGGAPLEPSPADLQTLMEYPWPGNVREMAAAIERAAILGGGHRLDLAGAMGTKLYAVAERASATPAGGPTGESLLLDRAVAAHIERVLRLVHGRVDGARGAAALLGVNPNTLRARMRKLGVDWARFRVSPPA
jgi:transcriptional regulator with GAF, ATPase, and Fis domain